MAKTFEKYVEDWFHSYLKGEGKDDAFYKDFVNYCEFPNDYEKEGKTDLAFLLSLDANGIWDKMFGFKNREFSYTDEDSFLDDFPSTEDMLKEIFNQCLPDVEWSFKSYFINTMVDECGDYDTISEYFAKMFTDPNYFLYTDGMSTRNDCLYTYAEYSVDMEKYRKCLVNVGMVDETEASNPHDEDHFVFMCRFCYENFCRQIASILLPDKF